MEIERRAFSLDSLKVETRADNARRIVGHAAVFNSPVEIGRWFREQVAPGAFARAIQEDDVRALFNHDANLVLGRNKAGTLAMREDERGLAIDIAPPDTQQARDVLTLIARGDISQMSFAFRVRREEWDETDPAMPLRTLHEVELYDVSPVTYPAYPTTDVGLRSLEAYRKEHQPRGLTRARANSIVRVGMRRRLMENGL